jgi:hypothetical protein
VRPMRRSSFFLYSLKDTEHRRPKISRRSSCTAA